MKTLVLEHRFMSVRYEDLGTGLPVVLLHAFPFDRAMWEPQLEPIAAAGFRVLRTGLAGVRRDHTRQRGLRHRALRGRHRRLPRRDRHREGGGGRRVDGRLHRPGVRSTPSPPVGRTHPGRHKGRAGRRRGEGQSRPPHRGREGTAAQSPPRRLSFPKLFSATTRDRTPARDRAGASDRPAPACRRDHRRALRPPRPSRRRAGARVGRAFRRWSWSARRTRSLRRRSPSKSLRAFPGRNWFTSRTRAT